MEFPSLVYGTLTSVPIPVYGGFTMVFRKCSLVLLFFVCCLSTVGAEIVTRTTERNYTQRNQIRLIPPSAPVRAEMIDSYTYREITEEKTYVVSYLSGPQIHQSSTYTSAAAANADSVPGDKSITTNTRFISEEIFSDTEIVSSSTLSAPPGGLAPDAIDSTGSAGRTASSEGMARGGNTQTLTASNRASNSLDATDGSTEEQEALLQEAAVRSEGELENRSTFAERYGDPVKLATGAMALTVADISVVMPGRAEDFSITRDYDSESTTVGFFGLGWSTGMESRLLLGRDEPHWPDQARISGEITGISNAIQSLENAWNGDKNAIEGSIQSLENSIEELELSRNGYNSLAASSENSAATAGYTLLANNCSNELGSLAPLLNQLESHLQDIEDAYSAERQSLLNARTELQSRLAYGQEQERINADIQSRNAGLIFPGQSMEMDKVGRETLVLIPLFGGVRQYGFDSLRSTGRVYRSEHQPLDELLLKWGSCALGKWGLLGCIQQRGEGAEPDTSTVHCSTHSSGDHTRDRLPFRLYGDRSITVEWNSDSRPKIEKILYGSKIIRTYTYRGEYLRRVVYPDGSFDQYSYQSNPGDSHERLYKVEYFTSANEVTPSYSRTYEYDSGGRVVKVEDTRGLFEEFSYQLNGGLITQASYTNSSGLSSSHRFNAQLQEIAVSSPAAGNTQFTRNELGRITARSDRRE